MINSKGIPLLWIILGLLAVMSENGQTLLSDPLYEEEVSAGSSSSSSLEGATAEARAAGCHFPAAWTGKFFQSGVHHAIHISKTTISTKGRCLEKEKEKYLIYNERDKCWRCLVFNEKHQNLLQYKETFCMPEKKSLREICSTITSDAYLMSLWRLDGVPIDCPFHGHFSVSYNRGNGLCEFPVSTLDSCTKSSEMVFNYQACHNIPGTQSSVEEIQCLGAWKEGSLRYFLALIKYNHHASYEERFRCFSYSTHGRGDGVFGHSNPGRNSHSASRLRSHSLHNSTYMSSSSSSSSSEQIIYRVSQSDDPTCNGLSSFEGSRTMTLKRVTPVKPCQFPPWILAHSHYHTLDQGSVYNFLSGNLRISNFSELAGTGPNSLVMNAICHQIQDTSEPEKALVILHATSDCKTGYICAAFHQRSKNIMEIQFGSMAHRSEDSCHLSHFEPTLQPYVTLVSSTPERIACPNVGYYQVTGLAVNGIKVTKPCAPDDEEEEDDDGDQTNSMRSEAINSVAVGCSSSDSIQTRAQLRCDQTDFFADYQCHGWWSDKNGIKYVVTTRSSSLQSFRPQRHCFAFRDLSWTSSSSSDVSPFHLEKQRVKSLENSFSSTMDDHDGQQDPSSSSHNNNNNNGKLLEFSSFADSCRRNVKYGQEGDFAFNLTKIGQCSDINSAPAGMHHRHNSLGISFHLFLTGSIAGVLLFANS